MTCCFSHSVTVTICLKTLFFFHLQYQNPGPGGILLPRLWSHRWFRHFSHHRPLFTNQETPGVYWGKSVTYWRGKHYAARKQTEKKRNWYLVQRAYRVENNWSNGSEKSEKTHTCSPWLPTPLSGGVAWAEVLEVGLVIRDVSVLPFISSWC